MGIDLSRLDIHKIKRQRNASNDNLERLLFSKGPGMSVKQAGRPTDYSEESIEIAQDYLQNFKEHGDEVPTRAGLAVRLGVTKQTVWDWCQQESKAGFSYLVKQIDAIQERVLVNKGLTGEHNSKVVGLMLAKHGYSEKHQYEHTGEGGGPIQSQYVITPVKPKELKNGKEKDKSKG